MARAKRNSQRVELDDPVSRKHAAIALEKFRAIKLQQLKQAKLEQRTRRQAIDSMRRAYETLCQVYLRTPDTTYQGWLDHGPKAEWDEVVAAAHDDAVWDRLVETYERRTHGHA